VGEPPGGRASRPEPLRRKIRLESRKNPVHGRVNSFLLDRMKALHRYGLFGGMVVLGMGAGALPAQETGVGPGFTAIFNGRDLTGWDGKPGAWEVRDGAIWCTGASREKNWLIWRGGQPGDFVLRLQFRWERGNSGVQVRSEDLGGWRIFGYQVEVAQRDAMGLWHHSLLPRDHPKKQARHLMTTAGEKAVIDVAGRRTVETFADEDEVQAVYREGAWNELEVIAEGPRLVQKINGVVFAELVDRDAELARRRGWIALQDHGKGCAVAFRNIELREKS